MRLCDICGSIDEAGRHVIAYAPGEIPVDLEMVAAIAAMPDVDVEARQAALHAAVEMTLQIRHPACCAAAGCDICKES